MTFDKMRSGKRDSIVLSRFLPLKDILKLEIVSDPEFSKIFFKSFNGQVPKIKYVKFSIHIRKDTSKQAYD